MSKLNMALLREVKTAFVPQPGGQGEPVAGASPMTAAMGAPMGVPAGGDPNAMAGGDPNAMAAGGGMPMMPPAGLDPAMAGMVGGGGAPGAEGGQQMSGTSMINITINDLIKLFKVFQQSAQPQAGAAPAPAAAPASDQKLDQVLELLKGALGEGVR